MPAFLIPAIAGAILSIVTSVVGRVLVALGFSVVSYTGLNAALSYFSDRMVSSANSAGATVAGMLGVLQLDACMSMFMAAGLVRLAIQGVSSGTFKRFVLK